MTTERKAFKKSEEWRSYKPRGLKDGAASKLQMKVITDMKAGKDGKKYPIRIVELYLVGTLQTGIDANKNAKFAWDDEKTTITVKFGEPDIGEFLAVLNGQKKISGDDREDSKFKGIFHKNARGSTSIMFERVNAAMPFRLSYGRKIGTGAPLRISHSLTHGEAQVLRVLLETALRQMYQW